MQRLLAGTGRRSRLLLRRQPRGKLLDSLNPKIVCGDLTRAESIARARFGRSSKPRLTIVDDSLALLHAAQPAVGSRFILSSIVLFCRSNRGLISAQTPADPQIG